MFFRKGDFLDPTIIVAILNLCGIFLGFVVGAQLIKYRLDVLEKKAVTKDELELIRNELHNYSKKVEKHNGLIERMYKVEGRLTSVEDDIKELKNEH